MTRVDLCLKSMFCQRYCECVIVGEPKCMFSLGEERAMVPLLAWTQVSTTVGDFVTLRLIRDVQWAIRGLSTR